MGVADPDFYELLGLDRNATTDQVKEAYREIARAYHPDSNFYDEILQDPLSAEDLAKFQSITSAYTVLVTPAKREAYDASLPPTLSDWDDGPDVVEDFYARIAKKRTPSGVRLSRGGIDPETFGRGFINDDLRRRSEPVAPPPPPAVTGRKPGSAGPVIRLAAVVVGAVGGVVTGLVILSSIS